VTFNDSTEGHFHDQASPFAFPTSPPLCFYYHGKPLHVQHHHGQWWLHSGDVLAVIGRRLGSRIQQLLAADPTTKHSRN
jgi:prophage antirepressor-like protein